MTGFVDMKPMDDALDCEAAESTCYYGSTKNLATEVSDEQEAAVFDTSDAEDAQSDIAETSSVLNASFTIDQNPRNLVARIEHLELRLAIYERKVEALANVSARKKRNREKQESAISRSDLERYVIEAVKHGAGEYGVSKPYIRKYMKEKCSVGDTRQIRRRLNKVLKEKVMKRAMELDDTNTFYKNLLC